MISVCGGFDGSENDDWTAIRLETVDGFQFTPTYGANSEPTIWNPAQSGGRIPRDQVDVAWDWLSRRYKFVRVYCDPGQGAGGRVRVRVGAGRKERGLHHARSHAG